MKGVGPDDSTHLFYDGCSASSPPHLHQEVLGHGVRYPAHFVVGLEDVIVDLKLVSAIIPVKTQTQQQVGAGVISCCLRGLD